MTQDIKKVTVFISSPGDVSLERGIVAKAVRQSENFFPKYAFQVFEFKNVASEFGKPGQEVVNEQLPEYDIYIGILGQRFGTPTDKFGSGTEEEFTNALIRKNENPSVHVALLFKSVRKPAGDMETEELQQYLKVKAFQSKVAPKGAYQGFTDDEELTNHVVQIIRKFISDCETTSAMETQNELLEQITAQDAFAISKSFFSDTLNSIGAELTNNHKSTMHFDDVYIPLDAQAVLASPETAKEKTSNEIISTDEFNDYTGQVETRIFVLGEESAGKSTLCKKIFLNYHKRGQIPVYVKGTEIKNASIDSMETTINNAFKKQYNEKSLPIFQSLNRSRKLLIIDDLEESKINMKYTVKLLKALEERYSHIICTAEDSFLMNLTMASPTEAEQVANYQSYKLRDMGHSLRDQLIQKWLKAGREEYVADEELYTATERCRTIVDNVLGTNFVDRKPIIILVLLQAIQGGNASDFAHGSFVRYYKYLIDTTLLSNIPRQKTDLYYVFLPEIAYQVFLRPDRTISNAGFSDLINEFCSRKGLDTDDLLEVQSTLVALNVLENQDNLFKFRHNFAYHYFLGQYLSDNIQKPQIREQIEGICKNLHLRQNANIIIFLSYHTRESLVIDAVLKVANSLFAGKVPFDLSRSEAQKINELVEESPKILISPEAKKERERILKAHDRLEPKHKEQDDPAGAFDLSAQINAAFRCVEIMGQLLKNHYAKFEAGPKQELYISSANVTLRMLATFIEHVTGDMDVLVSLVSRASPKLESKKDAQRAIFNLVSMVVFGLLKTTSKDTGADTLSKTYEEVLTHEKTLVFRILDFSIKSDFFKDFPMSELKVLAEECKDNKLAITTLRNLVKYRLYMRPIDDHKKHQQICEAVGLSLKAQLITQKKGAA